MHCRAAGLKLIEVAGLWVDSQRHVEPLTDAFSTSPAVSVSPAPSLRSVLCPGGKLWDCGCMGWAGEGKKKQGAVQMRLRPRLCYSSCQGRRKEEQSGRVTCWKMDSWYAASAAFQPRFLPEEAGDSWVDGAFMPIDLGPFRRGKWSGPRQGL